MKLKITKRSKASKSVVNTIRREGDIPAILYSKGQKGEEIALNGEAFKAVLRAIQPGCLSTTVFELEGEKSKVKAILKDIQYQPTTYNVWHLDFEELIDDVPVNVKVPIQCVGAAECQGIKLGGVLRQVIRTLKVNCLPKDIPQMFTVDISDLAINGTKRLKDLTLPKGVRPIADMNGVAVVVAKH